MRSTAGAAKPANAALIRRRRDGDPERELEGVEGVRARDLAQELPASVGERPGHHGQEGSREEDPGPRQDRAYEEPLDALRPAALIGARAHRDPLDRRRWIRSTPSISENESARSTTEIALAARTSPASTCWYR